MEANVAEALAEKARDPRLATMTQEDLVYEVLKECFDPEIPLNVVDLGLIYDVKVNPDSVDLKITMTSPQCPSHVSISEDIKTKLTTRGFPTQRLKWCGNRPGLRSGFLKAGTEERWGFRAVQNSSTIGSIETIRSRTDSKPVQSSRISFAHPVVLVKAVSGLVL